MKLVAFDVETHKVQPGLLAPPLVCGAIFDGNESRLFSPSHALDWLEELLCDEDVTICGANIAYDFGVCANERPELLPLIFKKYQDGLVFDILIAEKLHAIARGHLSKDPRTGGQLTSPSTGRPSDYSLESVTDLVLYETDAKADDFWRLRYAHLDGVPLDEWPPEAEEYPQQDVRFTWRVASAQLGLAPRMDMHQWTAQQTCMRCSSGLTGASRGCSVIAKSQNLHDHTAQVFASWCLHLGAIWGLRADGQSVAVLKEAALAGRAGALEEAMKLGFVRENGTEDQAKVKEKVALAYDTDPLSKCQGQGCVTGRVPTAAKSGKGSKACPVCNGTGLELGENVPRTDKGAIQIGRDTLTETGDEDLMAYAVGQEDDKVIDTYIPFLEEAVTIPVCLRPNNPLETGRVSYKDKSQVLPRFVSAYLSAALKKANAPVVGVRDCLVPRGDNVFFSVDYTGGELVTFAEACVERVGFSKMGEALVAGVDVHSALGATVMGVAYKMFIEMLAGEHGPVSKQRAKLFRQAAKPENFGNPGGMGSVKKVLQNRKQGPDTPHPSGTSMVDDGNGNFIKGYKGLRFCILTDGADQCGEIKITEWKDKPYPPVCLACVQAAERGREAWFKQWPEARPYLAWHSKNASDNGYVVQLYSKRVRGGTDFTSESNGDFQALLADIAKRALCRVVTEQYTDRHSPLFGSRTVVFAHDELFGETPESIGHEVCLRVEQIMVEEFQKGCPKHAKACKAEPTLMRRSRKDAGPVYANGRLIPWEDRFLNQGELRQEERAS